MRIEIPLGWHVHEERFKDPHQVLNGDKCGCICIECKQPLQAVQGSVRQDYSGTRTFLPAQVIWNHSCTRFQSKSFVTTTTHGMEIWSISTMTLLSQKSKYGKQPDIYLKDFVQVKPYSRDFHSNPTEFDTLDTYLNNNERVLEIDISSTRDIFCDYAALTALVLRDAPRTFLESEQNIEFDTPALPDQQTLARESPSAQSAQNRLLQALGWIAAGVLFVLTIIFFSRKRSKSKGKGRF